MRILLYVDDSDFWHQAARLVARFAKAEIARGTVLATAWRGMHRKRAIDRARRLLDMPESQIDTIERAGLVEYVLPEVAKETSADLVVVGRLGSLDRLTSGLVSAILIRRINANILLVRPHLVDVSRILVCSQGPRHGLVNYQDAARAARALNARLTILHVVSQMGLTMRASESLRGGEPREFLTDDPLTIAHLTDLRARLARDGIEGSVKVRRGLVVEEVISECIEGRHDLVVIGAHATTGTDAYLYEDFATHIVRASPVSILVVRSRPSHPATGDSPSQP